MTTTAPLRLAPSLPEPGCDGDAAAFAAETMVDGLRRSDPAATRQFFEIYSAKVERILRKLLGPSDELEDLLQDVFVDAIEGIDRLRVPAALGGWVMGIAVITAKRRMQKRFRRRWLSLSSTGTLPELRTSFADVEARAAFSSMHEVLGALRPEDRIALLLYRVDGLTADEGAEAMGISTSTFKRRLHRGERHLLKLAKRSTILRIWLDGEASWLA